MATAQTIEQLNTITPDDASTVIDTEEVITPTEDNEQLELDSETEALLLEIAQDQIFQELTGESDGMEHPIPDGINFKPLDLNAPYDLPKSIDDEQGFVGDFIDGLGDVPRAFKDQVDSLFANTVNSTGSLVKTMWEDLTSGNPTLGPSFGGGMDDFSTTPSTSQAKPYKEENLLGVSEDTLRAARKWENQTAGASLARGLGTFAAMWAATGPMKGIQMLRGRPIVSGAVRGVVSDFSSFSGYEDRLSDLLVDAADENPGLGWLKNPLTEALQADPDDHWAEARMKEVFEGGIIGGAFEALGAGMKALFKHTRKMKALKKEKASLKAMQEEVQRAADEVDEIVEKVSKGEPLTTKPAVTDVVQNTIELKPFEKTLDDYVEEFNIQTIRDIDEVISELLPESDRLLGKGHPQNVIYDALNISKPIPNATTDDDILIRMGMNRFSGSGDFDKIDPKKLAEQLLINHLEKQGLDPYAAMGSSSGFTPKQKEELLERFAKESIDIIETLREKLSKVVTQDEAIEQHKRILEDAIKSGSPIPEEVLEDYPDLVSKATLKSKNVAEETVEKVSKGEPLTETADDVAEETVETATKEAPTRLINLSEDQITRLGESFKRISETSDDDVSENLLKALESAEPAFNFGKIDSPDRVKQVMQELSEIIPDDINKVRGGKKVTNRESIDTAMEMLKEDIERIAKDTGDNASDLMAQLKSDAKSAKDLHKRYLAYKMMLSSKSREVNNMALRVVQNPLDVEAQKIFKQGIEDLAELQASVTAVRTGAARTTQVGNVITSDVLSAEELADSFLDAAKRGETFKYTKELSKAATLPDKVRNTFMSMFVNGLLSGTRTHVANLTSTLQKGLIAPAEQIIGGAFRLDAKAMRRGMGLYAGLGSNLMDGFRAFGKSLLHNKQFLDPARGIVDMKQAKPLNVHFTKQDIMNRPALEVGLHYIGSIVTSPTRMLQAADEGFKTWNYRAWVTAEATEEGVAAGLKGKQLKEFIQSKLDTATTAEGFAQNKRALDYAESNTWTSKLKQGTLSHSILKFGNSHPLTRIFYPFVRTPAQIIKKDVIFRIPGLGAATKEFREMYKNGDQFLKAELVSKQTTGIAITATGAYLAMNTDGDVFITGAGPQDVHGRKVWQQAGHQPYSLGMRQEDGSIKYISLKRFEPFGTVLGFTADAVNASGHIADRDWEELTQALWTSTVQSVQDKTYLQGITEFFSLIEGRRSVNEFVGNTLSGAMPFSKMQEDINRYNIDGGILKDANGFLDQFRKRIVGMSADLPPQRNIFGERISIRPGWGPDFLSPFSQSKSLPDDVMNELAKLEHGFRLPQDDRFLGFKIDLRSFKDDKGQDAYDYMLSMYGRVRVQGMTLRDALTTLIRSEEYQNIKGGKSEDFQDPRVSKVREVMAIFQRQAIGMTLQHYPELDKERIRLAYERQDKAKGDSKDDSSSTPYQKLLDSITK